MFAAAAGSRGETYGLEMGEQVKVVDLARNLIRLSGFIPDEDIQITFVGLRPGEKLYEELVGDNETVLSSGMPNVSRVQARSRIPVATLHREVSQLERLALEGRDGEVLAQLSVVIPEYRCEATTSPPR